MVLFSYIALDRSGREVRGRTEAAGERDAAEQLRKQALMVVRLDASAERRAPGALRLDRSAIRRRGGWVRERERVFFLRQMALMLRSGLTLLQALKTSVRQVTRRRLAECIERLADSIQSGERFSRALAAESRQFGTLAVKLVESAEASGEMAATLEQIAEQLERRLVVRRSLQTSLFYPAIVVVVSLAVAVFLVVKVIPQFAAFFAGRNVAMPPMTRLLMQVSAWVQNYGLLLLLLLAVTAAILLVAWPTRRGRLAIDRLMLRLPVAGKLLGTAAMARLARTLAALLESGVTLLEALRITTGVVGNRAVGRCLEGASERILEGSDLASSLNSSVIHPLVPQVVGVGERSGALTTALGDLGRFFERELDAAVERMSAIIEPALLLLVGGMVGFVYIAFFQAIFRLVS